MELGASARTSAETALNSPALEGKILGIYTLTEAAARQAETMLRGAIPGLTVDLNHDHGGSAALNAMVSRRSRGRRLGLSETRRDGLHKGAPRR